MLEQGQLFSIYSLKYSLEPYNETFPLLLLLLPRLRCDFYYVKSKIISGKLTSVYRSYPVTCYCVVSPGFLESSDP